jgi:hypothetical protein
MNTDGHRFMARTEENSETRNQNAELRGRREYPQITQMTQILGAPNHFVSWCLCG